MVKTWDQDCLGVLPPFESTVVQQTEHGVNEEFIFMTESKKFEALTNYLKVATLESRLSRVMKGKLSRNSTVSPTFPVLSAEASCPGIIDTGSSKSLIGQKRSRACCTVCQPQFNLKCVGEVQTLFFVLGIMERCLVLELCTFLLVYVG